jgi:hypothetical protein
LVTLGNPLKTGCCIGFFGCKLWIDQFYLRDSIPNPTREVRLASLKATPEEKIVKAF